MFSIALTTIIYRYLHYFYNFKRKLKMSDKVQKKVKHLVAIYNNTSIKPFLFKISHPLSLRLKMSPLQGS